MKRHEMMPWRKRGLARREEEFPFHSLQREMNRMFDRIGRNWSLGDLLEGEEAWGDFLPSVDVSETEKEIRVTAELPGMDEKDIDVTLRGSNLTIHGEKKAEKEEKGEQFYRKESSFGSFQRTIPLPVEVEEDKIEASFNNGILKIKLPKSAQAQKSRKKIEIH